MDPLLYAWEHDLEGPTPLERLHVSPDRRNHRAWIACDVKAMAIPA
jgi:hypothetical protein